MKFDFNKALRNIDETEAMDNVGDKFTFAKVIANNLGTMRQFSDPVKLLEWCRQLWKTGTVELDKSDQQKFKEAITKFDGASSFVVGQLLEEFDELKTPKPDVKKEVAAAAVVSENGVEAEATAETKD